MTILFMHVQDLRVQSAKPLRLSENERLVYAMEVRNGNGDNNTCSI